MPLLGFVRCDGALACPAARNPRIHGKMPLSPHSLILHQIGGMIHFHLKQTFEMDEWIYSRHRALKGTDPCIVSLHRLRKFCPWRESVLKLGPADDSEGCRTQNVFLIGNIGKRATTLNTGSWGSLGPGPVPAWQRHCARPGRADCCGPTSDHDAVTVTVTFGLRVDDHDAGQWPRPGRRRTPAQAQP